MTQQTPPRTPAKHLINLLAQKQGMKTTQAVQYIMQQTTAKQTTVYEWANGRRNPNGMAAKWITEKINQLEKK